MKKQFSVFILSLFTTMVVAQSSLTIHVTTPGTLKNLVTVEELDAFEYLTLTGTIDARDVKYMQNLATNVHAIFNKYAFANYDLRDVTIAEYIGNEGPWYPFYGNGNYNKIITYPANEFPKFAFADLSSLIIMDTGYGNLNSIHLPKSITSIGDSAFFLSDNISAMYSYSSTPVNLGIDAFSGIYINLPHYWTGKCKLYVPKGTSSVYLAANIWKEFTEIIEMVSTNNQTNIEHISALKVYKNGTNINIEGTKCGDLIEIYAINGILIKSLKSTGNQLILNVPNGKTYLIKTPTKTVKVVM